MPRTRAPYPAEFREQIIALAQAGLDVGDRSDGFTSAERDELRRLRRENRQLRQERDILSKGEPLKAPLV